MPNIRNFFLICVILQCQFVCGLTLDRVILSTDVNPEYIQFWPLAARAWKEVVGITPTLALISSGEGLPDDFDWDAGDILLFEPIEGIPTSFYARCIRNLLPVLFPDDVCILGDIDDIPLQRSYFVKNIADIPNDHFVVYSSLKWETYDPQFTRIAMCYNAAKGKVFQEIFKISSCDEIPALIKEWYKTGWDYSADEMMLAKMVYGWKKCRHRCSFLNANINRIDRYTESRHDPEKLGVSHYVAYHCPRPYLEYKNLIDSIVEAAFKSPLNRQVN